MAKGEYISINTNRIGDASATAKAVGTRMADTRSELKTLQNRLTDSLSSLEDYVGMCMEDVVPLGELESQRKKMDHVMSVMAEAAQLAEDTSKGLSTEADGLKLAIKVMAVGSNAVVATALSAIFNVIAKDKGGEDELVEIGDWGPTPEEIRSAMSDRYQRLRADRKGSFEGACSAFVYRQLCDLGVFKRNVDSGVAHAKNYYEEWGNRKQTSTGYLTEAYGPEGKMNPLEKLIEAHSGETLTNIAVSLDPKKNFFPDSVNGHVVLITAIKDGKVYFMESQSGSLHALPGNQAYKEGEPLELSVSDFLKQYPSINGVVHFYKNEN